MTRQPTPTAKCELEPQAVYDFLLKYYSENIFDLIEHKRGKHSQAFSYEHNSESFVIRFNTENIGFIKDKYAYDHFITKETPIPMILDMGIYEEGLHYCISKKVPGETGRDQYNSGNFSSLPLQYEMIEVISHIKPTGVGFGYLDIEGNAPLGSSLEYIKSLYHTENIFNWDEIFAIPFVDKKFTDHLSERMEYFAQFGILEQELLHGDFGSDNIFIKDGKISGIIDWEKARYGDHFLDVGRVLLFCPNKQETTKAALSFYSNKGIVNWKERMAMGVYHVVLTNYAYAAMAGNEISCKSSVGRLEELKNGLDL